MFLQTIASCLLLLLGVLQAEIAGEAEEKGKSELQPTMCIRLHSMPSMI